jgi:glycosyltransferase involved in cell wall biosynthesis
VKVFVHLAYGFAPATWRRRIENGHLLGINDCPAYGYARAESWGCSVVYSEDRPLGFLSKALRLLLRIALGFDFYHAWANRKNIFSSDVIWTHTESQSLAILALLFLRSSKKKSPRLIAQTIWLLDKWEKLTPVHRYLYRKLLSRSDILTFLSPLNLLKAKRLFPNQDCRLVKFGIRSDQIISRDYRVTYPIRILSIGNDIHRDWNALIDAFGGWGEFEVRIVTRSLPARTARKHRNITVIQVDRNDALMHIYKWADLLVVLLKENLHASGITVIQEGFSMGLPVIASNVGGLTAYFSSDEVFYLKSRDKDVIRQSILQYAMDINAQKAMVERAQAKMLNGGLNSEEFARQHFSMSQELVCRSTKKAESTA